MSLSAGDIQNIIKRVTEQVLQGQPQPDVQKGILAVLPAHVFDPIGVKACLAGKSITCALSADAQPIDGCKAFSLETDKRAIISTLAEYEEIVLVTPPLSLLQSIAQADDSAFAASLVLRPLLWGSKVSILLDFAAPKHMRGTALAVIAEHIDTLEKMGIGIKTIPRKSKMKDAKELVTEQDIKDACRDGSMKVKIRQDAIITQLAQDTAKECGVSIEY